MNYSRYAVAFIAMMLLAHPLSAQHEEVERPYSGDRFHVSIAGGPTSHGGGAALGLRYSPDDRALQFGLQSIWSMQQMVFDQDYRLWIGGIAGIAHRRTNLSAGVSLGAGYVRGSQAIFGPHGQPCWLGCGDEPIEGYPAILVQVEFLTHQKVAGLGVRPFVWFGEENLGGVTIVIYIGRF